MEVISIKGVEKSFGRNKILHNIFFSVNKGEILGIVGPSGSGKSVFIKTLINFYSSDSGEINVNSSIGFSMQNNSLYNHLTVKQNLVYFSKLYGVNKKQRKIQIPNLIKNLDLQEYENLLVKNLSGGTKKRVDIACSLVHNPDIVVLDEPFVGLDPLLVEKLSRFILLLNRQGKTIILSSHILREISVLCSRVALIKKGAMKEIAKSEMIHAYL